MLLRPLIFLFFSFFGAGDCVSISTSLFVLSSWWRWLTSWWHLRIQIIAHPPVLLGGKQSKVQKLPMIILIGVSCCTPVGKWSARKEKHGKYRIFLISCCDSCDTFTLFCAYSILCS